MKKLLLIPSAMIVLLSCENTNVETKETSYKIGCNGLTLKVITLEGCEYYFLPITGSYTMCHKGNCKNPIHYKNK